MIGVCVCVCSYSTGLVGVVMGAVETIVSSSGPAFSLHAAAPYMVARSSRASTTPRCAICTRPASPKPGSRAGAKTFQTWSPLAPRRKSARRLKRRPPRTPKSSSFDGRLPLGFSLLLRSGLLSTPGLTVVHSAVREAAGNLWRGASTCSARTAVGVIASDSPWREPRTSRAFINNVAPASEEKHRSHTF